MRSAYVVDIGDDDIGLVNGFVHCFPNVVRIACGHGSGRREFIDWLRRRAVVLVDDAVRTHKVVEHQESGDPLITCSRLFLWVTYEESPVG